uniref:RING-type domain-containing protein n=1 Tax=Kalanchoe fedtschenkoi TaxID=63787 RepID=A0A7N0TPZ4_KALFE
MAIPPDQFQIMLQHQQQNQHQHQQVAQSFRNMYSTDGRVGRYFPDGNHFGDQSQAYVPPFVVAGLAPVPLAGAADDNNGGCNLQFGYGVEPKKRKLEVQDFFENNSQISSQDILRPVPVSTGLGLSLDNGQVCSSGDSGFLSLIGEDLGKELQQQDEEIDRFLKVQAERMRQAVMQKMREQQMKTVSFLENKVLNKLHEKDSELRMINQKNMVLEDRLEKETMKLDLWKQRAKYNTTMMSALRQRLQEISEQNGLNKEGFGDSEIVDTASCCNGRGPDLYYLPKDHSVMQELTTCKGCGQKEVCMLLLPCKHLCLCKECESKLSLCPLCHSSKFFGMEVYI